MTGSTIRPPAGALTKHDLLEMYRLMVLARALSDRWMALTRQNKAGIAAPSDGHEAAQIGSAYALRPGVDWVVPYYRDMGVAVTLGVTPLDVLLAIFGRADDPASGGRQFPAHWSLPRLKIPTGSTVLATQIPHAAGIALASRIKREDAACAVYFGEGTTSEGDFHHGMNFAGIHRLPVIFFCENNYYSISTPQPKQVAGASVADRAPGYGFPGIVVDGMDVLAVYEATRAALLRALAGDGPTLIEAKTYRYGPHTNSDDDTTYRTRAEIDDWRRRDPILRFQRHLEDLYLLDADAVEEIGRRIRREVDEATAAAEARPDPDPLTLTQQVYSEW